MDYIVGSIKDDIFALISMIGEIEYEDYLYNGRYSEWFTRNRLKTLIDEKLLIRSSVNVNGKTKKTIRLSQPKGYAFLGEYSDELKDHFDLLERTGDKTKKYIHLYMGNSEYRTKRYLKSRGVQKIHAGVSCDIDFLAVIYSKDYDKGWKKPERKMLGTGRSVFDKEGNVKTLSTILREIRKERDDEIHFLTTRVILNQFLSEKDFFEKQVNRTVSIGAFVKEGDLFPVYYAPAIKQRWKFETEGAYLDYLKNTKEEAAPRSQELCDVIFLFDSEEDLECCFERTGIGEQVYSALFKSKACYLVPADNSLGNTVKLVTDKTLEDEILKRLIGTECFYREEDGYSVGEKEGVPIYSILGCDYQVMDTIARNHLSDGAHLVIHEWQVPLAEKYYKDAKSFYVLSEKAIAEFLEDGPEASGTDVGEFDEQEDF